MATFDISFNKTSGHEGGYANDSDDRGGETYRGIARKFWPHWSGWAEIDAAKAENKKVDSLRSKTLDQRVYDHYFDHFWCASGCDRLKDEALAYEVYDTAVNMGQRRSVLFLQEAVRLLGEKISLDGVIGPKTLAAANRLSAEKLVRIINVLQGERYLEIVRADASQMKFFLGWLRRADPGDALSAGKEKPAGVGADGHTSAV